MSLLKLLSVGGGGTPDGQELFTSSGTFTPGDGITSVSVMLIGGGAGGNNTGGARSSNCPFD